MKGNLFPQMRVIQVSSKIGAPSKAEAPQGLRPPNLESILCATEAARAPP